MNNRPETFEDVLNIEYAGALVRNLTWRTGSVVYDEDLVQEVLLRGVIAWRRKREIKHPRAFFGKIARDTISDHWRRRKASAISIDDQHILVVPTIEAAIDTDRRLARLKQAMLNLSETDRRLMELFYCDEHSISDLADLFDKSESAVKMKMLRCRQRLKQLLHQ